MGADIIINPNCGDTKETVNRYIRGIDPHVVFDAVGLPNLFNTCVDLVRNGGRCIMIGMPSPKAKVSMKPYQLFSKEQNII